MPRVVVLKKGLQATLPWTWVSDGHFAVPSYAQARHCRTSIFFPSKWGACGAGGSFCSPLSFLTCIKPYKCYVMPQVHHIVIPWELAYVKRDTYWYTY